MISDQQLRDGLTAVVQDFAATMIRQLAVAGGEELDEVAKRVSNLPALLTPARSFPPPAP